ncbi:MAG: NAD(P)H-dependent oxidoreductase [Spirochaetales bacterium]|nr:NAD(P)H-dependent oxidoreductase [Spirochaetales bacterium]
MDFLSAMKRRFACKRYDQSNPLTEAEISQILEFGRLTPTSFGLEPWSFHAVVSGEKKEQLYRACFEQETVSTSAMTVAVLVHTAPYMDPDGRWVRERGGRFPGSLDFFVEDYRPYHTFLAEEGRIDCWLRSQGYLAIANMMTGARTMGIQSCAIEGFDEQKVLAVLGADPARWQVSLLASFGHPAEAEREKIRLSAEELVVFH